MLEQVSNLTLVLELIEEEGAIGVQDVIGKYERDIVLSAWQTQCRWAWVIFIIAIKGIKLLDKSGETVVDVSCGVVCDMVVVPEG